MTCHDPQQVHAQVKQRYAKIAQSRGQTGCCEGEGNPGRSRELGYADEELAVLPAGADMGLGSGHPIGEADLQPGETVLDLGSGGGIDCLLAAKKVGPSGHVIGVDMTEAMVEAARRHAAEAGHENVTIHHGQIEKLPLHDASVDVVISNCVVNLSPDQPAVWREVFRVLKPGGRVAISDIVATQRLPEQLKDRPDLLCGCVSGAAARDDLHRWLREIGFADIRIEPREDRGRPVSQWLPDDTSGAEVISTMIHATKSAR